MPQLIAEAISEEISDRGAEDYLFLGARGRTAVPYGNFRLWIKKAGQVLGIDDLHPHDLRHTAASLAIAEGADVKVVQQMLGHASATLTLDLYGHLFDARLDEIGSKFDVAIRARDGIRTGLHLVKGA